MKKHSGTRRGGWAVAGLWALAVGAAHADIWNVTNTADSGPGSLRWAIEDAAASQGGDLVLIDENVTGTITLTSQLLISGEMEIQGPGANQLAVSGNNVTRVFKISEGAIAIIRDLTITNGRAPTSTATMGGGIYSHAASLTLERCLVLDCVAPGVTAAYGGGIYADDSVLTLTRVMILNCNANAATFAAGAALASSVSTTSITSSCIALNSLNAGTRVDGGGLYIDAGALTLTNCTISGNGVSANVPTGAAITLRSGVQATLEHCTIAYHSGPAAVTTSDTVVSLKGVLAAGNSRNFSGSFASLGGNLDSDGSSGLTNGVSHDKVGSVATPINARLRPLGYYGGPSLTVAVDAGSPAIDVGFTEDSPAVDQRGFSRVNGDCAGAAEPDSGAFEYGGGPGGLLLLPGDVVRAPLDAALDLTQPLTLEAWIEPHAYEVGGSPVMRIVSNRTLGGFGFGLQGGKPMFTAFGVHDYVCGTRLALNERVHLAVVFDGGHATFYLNGAFLQTVTKVASVAPANGAWLSIGCNPDGTEYWDGVIDELRMWNIARPSAAIAQDYNKSLNGNEAGLVAYWRFDEGAGDWAVDLVAGRVGELVESPYWMERACEVCAGDTDHDGDADLSDMATVLGSYGTLTGAVIEDGDFDADGDVDLSDLAAFLNAFGSVCS